MRSIQIWAKTAENDWRDVERLKLQCITIATYSSWSNFRFRQNRVSLFNALIQGELNS